MTDCSKHTKQVAGISDMKTLAEAVGDLHYESLAEFLDKLSDKLFLDAAKDRADDRRQLANFLEAGANNLQFASIQIESAWEASKPFMDQNTKE